MEMIQEALENSDRRSRGYRNRRLAFKRFNALGTLKVVYVQETDTQVIVTVIWE